MNWIIFGDSGTTYDPSATAADVVAATLHCRGNLSTAYYH